MSQHVERSPATESETADEPLPNCVTIVGRGHPSNFELTVDGEVRPDADDPASDGLIVSGGCVEGSIAAGTARFRFSGSVANLRLGDGNGAEPGSSSAPTAHVTYGVTEK